MKQANQLRRPTSPRTPKTEIEKLKELIKTKEGHLTMLQDALKQKEEEILVLKARHPYIPNKELFSMKQSIKQSFSNSPEKLIENQNRVINEFKGSIVYPLFLLTRRIGKTKIGNKIGLLLKSKKK